MLVCSLGTTNCIAVNAVKGLIKPPRPDQGGGRWQMKTKLIGLFALEIVLGTSCKKEKIEKQNAMITIDVECAACALVFNTEYNPETLLEVRGKGSYSFELDKMDTQYSGLYFTGYWFVSTREDQCEIREKS